MPLCLFTVNTRPRISSVPDAHLPHSLGISWPLDGAVTHGQVQGNVFGEGWSGRLGADWHPGNFFSRLVYLLWSCLLCRLMGWPALPWPTGGCLSMRRATSPLTRLLAPSWRRWKALASPMRTARRAYGTWRITSFRRRWAILHQQTRETFVFQFWVMADDLMWPQRETWLFATQKIQEWQGMSAVSASMWQLEILGPMEA